MKASVTMSLKRKLSYEKRLAAAKEFKNHDMAGLINEIVMLRERLELAEELIQELEATLEEKKSKHESSDSITEKLSNLKLSGSLLDKVELLIRSCESPLCHSQILHFFNAQHKKSASSLVSNSVLQVALYRAGKSGRLIRIKLPGIKAVFFAHRNWADENGKVLKVYLDKINLSKDL